MFGFFYTDCKQIAVLTYDVMTDKKDVLEVLYEFHPESGPGQYIPTLEDDSWCGETEETLFSV